MGLVAHHTRYVLLQDNIEGFINIALLIVVLTYVLGILGATINGRTAIFLDLAGGGELAAEVTEEMCGLAALDGEAHVLEHLPLVDLHVEHGLDALAQHGLTQRVVGEGPHGDRAEEPDLHALLTQLVHHGLDHAGDGAEGGDDKLRVLGLVAFPELLVLPRLGVDRLQQGVVLAQGFGVDVDGVDDAALGGIVAGLPAGAGPGLGLGIDLEVDHLGHFDRLHHLGDDAVSQEQHGHAVLLRLLKGEHHDVDGLLHGGGSVGQQVVVAVAAALDALEIVALGGLDVAETGAAAHDVQDHARETGAGAVGNALLLQRNAGAGGGGDDARAGTGGAVHHVDRRDLALGLEEAASDLGHTGGHVFGDLSLRGDGVAEEETRAGADGGLSDRFGPLHKSQSHCHFLLNLSRSGWPHPCRCGRRTRSRCTPRDRLPRPGGSPSR